MKELEAEFQVILGNVTMYDLRDLNKIVKKLIQLVEKRDEAIITELRKSLKNGNS